MFERIKRAILLDARLYRMVADDPAFLGEAAIIVVIAALLSAVGNLRGLNSVGAFFLEVLNTLILGWVVWAALAAWIGVRLGGRSNFQEMLRTLGYANAPRFIAVLGIIPLIGWIFRLIAFILTIIAGVIAIRESMEFSTGNAVATAILSLLLYIVAGIVIGILFAGLSLIF